MRIALLTSLLMTQAVLANNLTYEEYSGVKIGVSAKEALSQLNHYNSDQVLHENSGSCYYLSPPDEKIGAFIMIFDGVVARFDIETDQNIFTLAGIGIGSSKQQVIKAYPIAVVSPHHYLGAEGEYLEVKLSPKHGIIFEMARNKVTSFRIGSYPAIQFVEGCA